MSRKSDTGISPTFVPMLVGFGTIILMLGGFSAWAMRAEIDGAVMAPGRIVVDRNRQAVQHLDGGVVDKIFVQEGDIVSAGDLLVMLDPTVSLSELKIVEGQLYELMARRGRLEAEREERDTITFDPILTEVADRRPDVQALVEGQERLFRARRDNLDKSVTQLANQKLQLEKQIEGIDAQTVALDRQDALIKEETTTQETLLEKGLAQNSRVLSLRREDARLAGLKGELTSRRAEAMERISELSIQLLRLHTQRREEAISMLRDLQYNEMEATERRSALLTLLERMDIRAPVSGIAYDVRLFGPRSVIKPADPILFIIPKDRPLIIAAEVDASDVNKVSPNQEVILRFSAFDMRSTPDLIGRVTRVSPDVFNDQQSGRSYYRTEVELPKSEIEKLPEGQILIPGMPAQTFIRTGEHSPMDYLTKPITRYFQKSMRDGA
ncbi:HlyD family type I secretion periplasmic adaptor subunit [Antarcticimicrobium sediminis]|uniref:Membrane fusion protein (MFP) family protein n=1 Tax=Antarcticimicrobium sediminis TaxID=2546227 RepID=A0A4R5F084_9RHOB|nr:HlyD family type I secretion periplasmic adaptor subunit [Antarcticimicrobium sediminis]TDE40672.1 HlyD family type I secretion periplasmic adaptor subunit [Antarcticimicrobium sediminis]